MGGGRGGEENLQSLRADTGVSGDEKRVISAKDGSNWCLDGLSDLWALPLMFFHRWLLQYQAYFSFLFVHGMGACVCVHFCVFVGVNVCLCRFVLCV